MMTIGANMLPIFEVPSGCIKKSRTKMAQDTPTIVGVVIVASTMLRLEKGQRHGYYHRISSGLPLNSTKYRLSRREDAV